MDNVPQETHAGSVVTHKPGNIGKKSKIKKDDRLLLHQIRRKRLTKVKENQQKKHIQATKRKALQIKGAKFHADTGFAKTRHENFGILPCVKTTSQKKDAYMERRVSSDMLRQRTSPTKGHRKVVQKDQLRY